MDRQPRVLAIHDVSCLGRCSLTVALPVISATGTECSVIPTAVLSTHTGGFTGYTYRDLTGDIAPITDHWVELGISFDAIYTGFLGSREQIDIVKDTVSRLRDGRTLVIVDPAMADFGAMYPIFDMDFAKHMSELCAVADVIVPNMTEAFFMLGRGYVPGPYTQEFIMSLLSDLCGIGAKKIVLTGVYFDSGRIGAAAYDSVTGEVSYSFRDMVPGQYHGTGDIFASVLTAALVKGRSLRDSASIAVDFTVSCIRRTYSDGTDVKYGVRFETGLGELAREIGSDVALRPVSLPEVPELAVLAASVWKDCYSDMLPEGQVDYMLDRFQSEEAIAQQISEEGYRYSYILSGGKVAGYVALHPEGSRLFISKLYLMRECRGKGIGSAAMSEIFRICQDEGYGSAYLTVNKGNVSAVKAYERNGFIKTSAVTKDIGKGYVMDDYIMEKVF